MSDHQPTEPIEFETAGPERSGSGGRRTTVIASVAAVVAVALGGGAYAAWSFLDGGGPQPQDVLPSTTIAVVSVDLDPSAGQKIAAIKAIRKFPALKKELGLNADDDLREFIFDKVLEEGDCTGTNFEDDIKPWLGKRAAFAAVEVDGQPAPVIALQVSDPKEARTGFDAIVKCTDPDDFAFVVGDDYLIASDSAEHAKAVLDEGQMKPLGDDAAYRRWTDEAGDAGVMNFYVARSAVDYVDDLFGDFGDFGVVEGDSQGEGYQGEGDAESAALGSSAPMVSADGPTDAFTDALKGFKGMAGAVRFADGGMELSVASGGLNRYSGDDTVGAQVGDLPDDTAAVLGLAVPDDFAELVLDSVGGVFGSSEDMIAQAEEETGLDLPEDLQTLLGDSLTLSLGGDAPESPEATDDLANVPAGLLVKGDADVIRAVVSKLEEHTGVSLSDIPLVLTTGDGRVALATSERYADTLLKGGDLGSEGSFDDVVPDADKASQLLYLDFNSEWRTFLADLVDDGGEADDNTAPLRSVGLSAWQDGEVSHQLVKVTTD